MAAVDFSRAVVVTRGVAAPVVEQTAARVLVEEVKKRTGIELPVTAEWPAGKAVIAIDRKSVV